MKQISKHKQRCIFQTQPLWPSTRHEPIADAQTCTATENVTTRVTRTGQETKDTGQEGLQQRASLGHESVTTQAETLHTTGHEVSNPYCSFLWKSPWFELQWRKNSVQRNKCPHQFSSNLMDVSEGATARSFAITHASLPYHSQHLPAWQMSACHSLTRFAVHACAMCVLCVCYVCVSRGR